MKVLLCGAAGWTGRAVLAELLRQPGWKCAPSRARRCADSPTESWQDEQDGSAPSDPRVELLYADSRSGGDLVVLRTIGDLPSRARVTLTPATVASVSADADREELPNSLLQFVERESPGALERLEGSGTASPASSVASFGLTPRITPRMARADELLSMLEGLG